MAIQVNTRDFCYFILGVIVTVFIGGFAQMRLAEERQKTDVSTWLQSNRVEKQEIENRLGCKIANNTGQPGTIRVDFSGNNAETALGEIGAWLARHQCPYGISMVSDSKGRISD